MTSLSGWTTEIPIIQISLATYRTQYRNETAHLQLFLESFPNRDLFLWVGVLFRFIYSCWQGSYEIYTNPMGPEEIALWGVSW